MTQTFTSQIHETAIKTKKAQSELPEFAEPSDNVLDNILNFSKNLEIKKSRFVDFVETIKS